VEIQEKEVFNQNCSENAKIGKNFIFLSTKSIHFIVAADAEYTKKHVKG
jgi:hypothetical protein